MNLLTKKLSFKKLLCLLLIFVGMMQLMRYFADQVAIISGGIYILDLNLGNSPDFMEQTLTNLGEKGRFFYRHNFFLVDFFYPIAYACFYAYGILFAQTKAKLTHPYFRFLCILPFVAMVNDWLENLFISLLILNYPVLDTRLFLATNIATYAKFIFVYASLLLMISFIFLAIIRYFKHQ